MLELIAVVCVFVIIPIALVLPNLAPSEGRDNSFGHVPYVMAGALAGWLFLGIWVPYAVTVLCALYLYGAHLQAKSAKEETQARKVVIHRKPDATDGEKVWRGPEMGRAEFQQPSLDIKDGSDVDARLQAHYDDLQDGKITLEDYKAHIEVEFEAAKSEIEHLREMRRYMEPDDYEDQRELADENLEAARWRLRWVKQKIRGQGSKPDWMGRSGKWASFEYADSSGVLSKHHITMWKAYPDEVRGWDRKMKAEVGFAYDQIHDWQAG